MLKFFQRQLILILLVTFSESLQAQGEVETLYQAPFISSANHVLETGDGNLLISGYSIDVDLGMVGCIVLVDPLGNQLWEKPTTINLINSVLHAVELDNSFIIAGNSDVAGLLFKVDKNSGQWIDSTSLGPCEIGARPPVPFFTGNCGYPFVGEHALIKSLDGIIVGGYYPFKTSRAYLARFNEDFSMDMAFRDRIDSHIESGILWGKEIIDIERSMVDGDILIFGQIDANTQECGLRCIDDVGCTPCNDDIWVTRFTNQLDLEYSRALVANACEQFTDAVGTPDNGFAVIGSSRSTECSAFGPNNIAANFKNDWFWKFGEQANSERVESLNIMAGPYQGRSIQYNNGYLVGGCFLGIVSQAILVHYDDQFQTDWTYTHDCFSSCFEYSIQGSGNCYYAAGFCQPNSETNRKLLLSFGTCEYMCDDALPINCGEDALGDTRVEGLVNNIDDYSWCQSDLTGFDGPELVYELKGFRGGDDLFISMDEISKDAGFDVFVIENCQTVSEVETNGRMCVDFEVRTSGDDPPALLTIEDANPQSQYYVIVDSRGDRGDFRLSVSCFDDCEQYVRLECDDPIAANNIQQESSRICAYNCTDLEDPYVDQYTESEYRAFFTAPEAADYSFHLNDLSSNLDLFVLDQCNPFACIGRGLNEGTTAEVVTLFLEQGQTVYVIVDALEGTPSSNFVLSVECCNDITCGCEDTQDIFCGLDVSGNNGEGQSRLSDYSSCNPDGRAGFGGPELIYRIAGSQFDPLKPNDLFLSIIDDGGLDVFVVENCNSNSEVDGAECIYGLEREDANPGLIHIRDINPSSDYFVIVDSRGLETDFNLSVSCPEDCANDSPISCNQPRVVNSAVNGSAKICAYYHPESGQYFDGYTAPDYKVPFIAPRDGFYTFVLSDMQANVQDMFLLRDCNPFQCIGFSTEVESSREEVALSLFAGDTLYVVLDALGRASTTFTLTVECCEAQENRVFLDEGNVDTLICLSENQPAILNLLHSGPEQIPYKFFLTDSDDFVEQEIQSPFDVAALTEGSYRIYGVSYQQELAFQPGQPITTIAGSICEVISENFIDLLIGRSHESFVNVTICPEDMVFVCDTFLSEAGTHVIRCLTDNGCDSIITVQINIDAPIVNIGGNLQFCTGETTTLSATPGFLTYAWSTGETSESIEVGMSGNYSVTVTGSSECISVDEVEVTEVEPPIVQLITDTAICLGMSIALLEDTDCPECVCTWTPTSEFSDPSSCDVIARPNAQTSYTLTTTKEGVCVVTNTVTVSLREALQLNVDNDHLIIRRENVTSVPIDSILINDTIFPINRKVEQDDVEISLLFDSEFPTEIQTTLTSESLDFDVGAILDLHTFEYLLTDKNCGDQDTGTIQLQVIRNDQITLCNPDEERVGCPVLEDVEDYGNNDIAIFDREGNIVHLGHPYRNDWKGINIQTGGRVPTGSYYFVLHLGEKTRGTNVGQNGGVIKGVITIIRR